MILKILKKWWLKIINLFFLSFCEYIKCNNYLNYIKLKYSKHNQMSNFLSDLKYILKDNEIMKFN